MLARLRNDFILSVTILLAACVNISILPFTVYRVLSGEYLIAAIEAVFVIVVSALAVFAWRTGNGRLAGLILAWFCPVVASVVAILKGGETVLWMYPSFVAPFFLVPPWMAVLINVSAGTAVVLFCATLADPTTRATFIATSMVVSLFAFIFAFRSEAQRRRLANLAAHDALTGLGNRRTLEEALQFIEESNRRVDLDHGLILFDLDHFKRINDDFGHETGDRVLVDLARLVSKDLREQDRAFRFGGEEFVLLLPHTGIEGTAVVAEKLRARIEDGLRRPEYAVTASLGAAILKPGERWEAWLHRADSAMYRAKAQGRNCLVVDQDT